MGYATITVVLGAIGVVASVAMAAAVAVAMAAALELGSNLGLLVETWVVYEVAHVVCSHVAELAERDSALHRRQDLGERIDFADLVFDSYGLIGANQVKLVQQDLVGKRHLLIGLVDLPLFNFVLASALH